MSNIPIVPVNNNAVHMTQQAANNMAQYFSGKAVTYAQQQFTPFQNPAVPNFNPMNYLPNPLVGDCPPASFAWNTGNPSRAKSRQQAKSKSSSGSSNHVTTCNPGASNANGQSSTTPSSCTNSSDTSNSTSDNIEIKIEESSENGTLSMDCETSRISPDLDQIKRSSSLLPSLTSVPPHNYINTFSPNISTGYGHVTHNFARQPQAYPNAYPYATGMEYFQYGQSGCPPTGNIQSYAGGEWKNLMTE
uniref:YTH domain-containing protein n=1 Tax=Rhabditophanes sp. KR3021 TaxID=114890 RepID=A0AC35UGB7_9BILA